MAYSIVIPSRNLENITRCTAAIRESGCHARVIIVDDTETLELNYRNVPGFPTSIPGVRPFCFATNVNNGINAARRDDVIVMNDDALIQDRPYGSAFVTANQLYGNPINALSRAAEDNRFGIVSAAVIGASKTMETDPRHYPHMKELFPETWDLLSVRPIEAAMVPFICVYIPRSTIDRAGRLDERFTDYGGEDNDYCRRVREAGLRIGVYDGCVVDHGTLQSTFRPDGKGRDVSIAKKQYVDKWGDASGW